MKSGILPCEASFSNGIRFRSDNLKTREKLIIGIPGGPGISGTYMDVSIAQVASFLGGRPIVIALPNHDGEVRWTLGELDWKLTRDLILENLMDLRQVSQEIILVAHSFGALLILDALNEAQGSLVDKLILVSTPDALGWSEEMKMELQKRGLSSSRIKSESDFQGFWRTVLPLFFETQLSAELASRMSEQTFFTVSLKMGEGSPQLDRFRGLDRKLPLIFIEGSDDIVSGRGRLSRLKELFPEASLYAVNESGHFPMVERPQDWQDLLNQILR